MTLSVLLLAVLEESPLPVATPDLVAIAGGSRAVVWSTLRWLESTGWVRRAGRVPGTRHRTRLWVATKWDAGRAV